MQCKELIHPFQNDPGISQRQRVMDDLLAGPAQIDGRSLADLLDYFQQLSRHINYYDATLKVTDWQPFFQHNLPFTVAAILKYDGPKIADKLGFYHQLFDKKPSKASLQLLFSYTYNAIINPINNWSTKLKDTELPVSLLLEKLIKDKLSDPLKMFIVQLNTAVKWYHIRPLNFNALLGNEVWNLDITDLYAIKDNSAFKASGSNKAKRLIALADQMIQLTASFSSAAESLAPAAELSMEPSFLSLKEELQEKHSPHLALLFSFLKLFKHVQSDLNSLTKKHLDFFYREVLLLKAKQATPDKTHLVFEIQNQLQKYLLKKGLLLKDGKDSNKMEIQFSLDDELVVNKTQVAAKRTLFVNNQVHGDHSYVEGVYIAPDAGMADGVEKAFSDDQPASWPTLGACNSKYTDPQAGFIKPYPNARLGFLLGSAVLLLAEGERKITITLSCSLNNNVCSGSSTPSDFYAKVQAILNQTFYCINRDLIAAAVKKGISNTLKEKLIAVLVKEKTNAAENFCYHQSETLLFEKTITETAYFSLIPSLEDRKILSDIFKPTKALNIAFSGKKNWIVPLNPPVITMSPLTASMAFRLMITAELPSQQEGITFYDEAALKESFETELPLLKIEIDDRIKLQQDVATAYQQECCEKKSKEQVQPVSLYHFFRNVKISAAQDTKIEVSVCGLKNFVVQNNESLQNVNGPIYPFGTRPEVIDFDIKNPPLPQNPTNLNLIGPDFYIGSKEVFCKKWNDIYINLDWKDKPTSFRDYYKGYLKEGTQFGLDQNKFLINLAVLEQGKWKPEKQHNTPATIQVSIQGNSYHNRRLFDDNGKSSCVQKNPLPQTIHLRNTFFDLQQEFLLDNKALVKYDVNAFNGFLKINLQLQDFCHKVYSYVLARQMMALGKLPDSKLEDAIYYDASGNLIVFSTNTIKDDLETAKNIAMRVESDVNHNTDGIKAKIGAQGAGAINDPQAEAIRKTVLAPTLLHLSNKNLTGDVVTLRDQITQIRGIIDNNDKFQAVIPNEPWTPIIKNITIDYTATATIKDIELIHLYPYPGTFKKEQLQQQPALFPTFCEEGTLFLALKDLEPGSNVSLLFQMAEATADSESQRVALQWCYLENNTWKPLRKGFEVLQDDTDGLTTSGILKLALPANMSKANSVLPKDFHWLKAAIAGNSKSVSETIGIHTQAMRATFTNSLQNDKLRLAQALPAGAIEKLKDADAAVKKITQPYDSFGGSMPEGEGHFYTRVSELLRHKGRAIQKFDYERLALEAFPQLFKVKCINHSFALDAHRYVNDMPMAPGYILLAVIPDLNQLKAARQFEPRVPVSLLERIQEYLKERSSPFVRLKVMNPRYERVNFCLKVKLYQGRDAQFYQEKLSQDLREFLAPWAVGVYDKLTFGQCINQSAIVGFLETRDYLDYVIELKMQHEDDQLLIPLSSQQQICPITPRSILLAGNIEVFIAQQDCESWASSKQYPPCANSAVPIANYCKD